MSVKLLVPPPPTVAPLNPVTSTLFLWPGLQPNGKNYLPIDNGVLQPVLTWGSSCAPGKQPTTYSSWWVSAQYVNTYGSEPGYTGCLGGEVMKVNVGDTLLMEMNLKGTVWKQKVTNLRNKLVVTFDIDLKNQNQNRADFAIEIYDGLKPSTEINFTDININFDSASSDNCKIVSKGDLDYVSTPKLFEGGKRCELQTITLRVK